MEAFTASETEYLKAQRMGRLATTSAGGEPHVVPVNYSFNAVLQTIDIHGYRMAQSKKFRDVARTGKAAFVVDTAAYEFQGRTVEAAVGKGSDGPDGD